jgi:hypothetical protein
MGTWPQRSFGRVTVGVALSTIRVNDHEPNERPLEWTLAERRTITLDVVMAAPPRWRKISLTLVSAVVAGVLSGVLLVRLSSRVDAAVVTGPGTGVPVASPRPDEPRAPGTGNGSGANAAAVTLRAVPVAVAMRALLAGEVDLAVANAPASREDLAETNAAGISVTEHVIEGSGARLYAYARGASAERVSDLLRVVPNPSEATRVSVPSAPTRAD